MTARALIFDMAAVAVFTGHGAHELAGPHLRVAIENFGSAARALLQQLTVPETHHAAHVT